mmetsp:Transcript_126084/g.315069  ORF Transcript_126084/g.315069 Transcript_126084/m.315069 type:complete len:235 (+) Transcript_126084:88-792(+)|eukprot:CAMPEP_0115669772 /NCGR_PEP_ID=MMETSP0272-20121206/51178_1 /TAXON_ID=71861 /ORGANISM="Scrippsiella trochoidea, Strain CCMP3099" /LENGTH=234 /DNA_ID=CAMNT_0003108461 /DNA_START=88 /DNA_END=792 /DNA_ORIENTATION=-
MQHLKECPWNQGESWRPAQLQLAQTHVVHRGDLSQSRNFNQHQQVNAEVIRPLGFEETCRRAVRAGLYPTKQEAMSASFCQGGFEEFLQTGGSVQKGQTLNATLQKLTPMQSRSSAARYGLVPRVDGMRDSMRPGSGRCESEATSRDLSSRESYTSSTSPLVRAGCPPAATILPRTGSAPALGASTYSFRNNLAYSGRIQKAGGVHSIAASGQSAGGRDYKGFAGGGRGCYIGF